MRLKCCVCENRVSKAQGCAKPAHVCHATHALVLQESPRSICRAGAAFSGQAEWQERVDSFLLK